MIIDKPLLSLNEYIKIERGNKYAAANIKKSETRYCEICSKNRMKAVSDYPVDILVKWYTKGRKDSDNVDFGIKFILDGMVKAGVLENDSPKFVRNIYHQHFKDKNEHCEVILGQFELIERITK